MYQNPGAIEFYEIVTGLRYAAAVVVSVSSACGRRNYHTFIMVHASTMVLVQKMSVYGGDPGTVEMCGQGVNSIR